MDASILNNPLAAVQLIPIYSYMNILSDFLFFQNYLTKDNQTKQIPIINALYEYVKDEPDSHSRRVKLIRKLLEGSDMYGEKHGELYDTTFANTMFDYIISSVVFGKYGNIFGFLADVVRRVDNLQVDNVLEKVKEALNGTYENNYGDDSKLSHLAISRIYHDMILPLFPQTKNMSLLSLDYMFAQAGAMYLRLGRLNDTYNVYFSQLEPLNFDLETFNDYLTVGHIINSLLHHQQIDHVTYRSFTLPVLFHYVTTEKAVKNQPITNVIFSPEQWRLAYHKFLDYVQNSFNKIDNQLLEDPLFRIHKLLSGFKNYAMMADFILNNRCAFIHYHIRKTRIPVYLEFADDFECRSGEVLPNLDQWFMDQIRDFGELYEEYDLQTTQKHFNETLKDSHGLVIKLVAHNNQVFDALGKTNVLISEKLPYDLLEFNYNNDSKEYYLLKRENYTVTLVRELDDPEVFKQIVGEHLGPLLWLGDRIVLKFPNESIDEFVQELMKYKKEKLKIYLNYADEDPRKDEWWKEFGLSLMISYPCFSNSKKYEPDDENQFCEQDIIKFLNKFPEDVSSLITNTNSRSLLSELGTTIRTLFLKHKIDKRIDKFLTSDIKYYDIEEELSLHLEEPNFETKSITENGIANVETIIFDLKRNIKYNSTFVDRTLNRIKQLVQFYKPKHIRNIGQIQQPLLVNSRNGVTGYGYSFIIVPNNTEKAFLRTGYDFKDEMIISLCLNSTRNEKTYIKLNSVSLDYEPNYFIYDINDQLRRKSASFRFSGISMYHDNNDNCNNYTYLERTNSGNICRRQRRMIEKINYLKNAVIMLRNNAVIAGNVSMTKGKIHNMLEKYVMSFDNTSLSYFVNNWLNYNFEQSVWARSNVIENLELLDQLRYNSVLDVSISDGEKIDSLYTYRERSEIEKEASIEDIIKDFNNQKARFVVTFEDYYAVRNFATNGERRITSDTNEAKRMKLALYKLAIRQFDDQEREFGRKLYRVECKPVDYMNELGVGKVITFTKFTSTLMNEHSAKKLAGYSILGFVNILYDMEIIGPYMRAKIELIDALQEIILLPGIKFRITNIVHLNNYEDIGYTVRVVLSARFNSQEKYESYKHVMREIGKINL